MEKKKEAITAVIVQARMNSSRFYGKVLKKINKQSLLEILLFRIKTLKETDKIIVATSNSFADKKIVRLCKKNGFDYFVGSEKNVQARYYNAAKKFNVKNIIRITADCPLIDIYIIKKIKKLYFDRGGMEYVSNVIFPTFPDGMDVEMFPFELLRKRVEKKVSNFEKEHVTTFFVKKKIKKNNLFYNNDYSSLRLTVDTIYDYQIIKNLIKYFNNNIFINLNDIISLYDTHPCFFKKNQNVNRNLK